MSQPNPPAIYLTRPIWIMARNPGWLLKVVRNHVHRPADHERVFRRPFPHNERMRFLNDKSGDHLISLMRKVSPADADSLKERWHHTHRYSQIAEYFSRRSDMDKWLDDWLNHHPDIRKQYLKARYLSERPAKESDYPHSQITVPRRLDVLNRELVRLIQQLGIRPTSFLDVGAAFQPVQDKSLGEEKLVPALSTIEARNFFYANKIPMKFVATDVVPISKQEQRELLAKHRIKAFQQDYRERPPSQKFSIIRMANVSSHMNREVFVATLLNLFQVLEPEGLLVIANRTVVGPPIQGNTMNDEFGVYQKVKMGGAWTLRQIALIKEKIKD